ncbi:hypothetical protein D1007_22710 [Hordeum vulgare]|nr:hypothetical protein D1007_22710 [Hordeum vulgare]
MLCYVMYLLKHCILLRLNPETVWTSTQPHATTTDTLNIRREVRPRRGKNSQLVGRPLGSLLHLFPWPIGQHSADVHAPLESPFPPHHAYTFCELSKHVNPTDPTLSPPLYKYALAHPANHTNQPSESRLAGSFFRARRGTPSRLHRRHLRLSPSRQFSVMASSSGRRAVALAALVVVLLVTGAGLVGAARPAPADRSGDGAMYPAAVVVADRARETVEMLMARLPAGPSPKGPGH